jgi:hypothetical protein
MTENGPERWARLDELYHAALEKPEEQRDAFLRSACGDDEALHREVGALIEFHGHEGFFDKSPAEIAARLQVAIEDPAKGQDAAASGVGRLKSSDSIPTGGFAPGVILMGRYRIIGLLGRGGMGEVYRADDLKLGQPVALKFLPPALATDPVIAGAFHCGSTDNAWAGASEYLPGVRHFRIRGPILPLDGIHRWRRPRLADPTHRVSLQ